jgi:integrase
MITKAQGRASAHTLSTQRKHITLDVVKRLAPGHMVWDAPSRKSPGIAGFAVRCQRRDKVYMLKTRVNGRIRRFTIGKHGDPWTPDMARKEASAIKSAIAAGKDPAAERDAAKSAPTIRDVAEMFLTEHVEAKLRPKTAASYMDLFNRLILPKLGRHLAANVTEADLATFHHGMRGTPRQANLCIAVASKMFAWAETRGYRPRGSNPCVGIERFKEGKRERFLSTAEFGRLGATLAESERGEAQEDAFVIAAIRLLVFTGARLGEVLSLKWDYVDFERGMLNLPESKTGSKTIHLNAPALQILSDLGRVEDNPFVFPGRRKGRALVNIQRPWEHIRKRAGLEGVRLHDLRHSYASVAVAGGGSLPMIGKLLGHAQSATTERYAHLADDPVRQVNEDAGRAIEAAMALDKNSDVVKLRQDN